MASLIEELISVLEEETGCYQALLDMADNKKDVIINGDVPSLQEITKEEQELAGHILRLEKKREENLNDLCTVINKKAEELTIHKLITSLPGNEKIKLKEVSMQLERILTELRMKNETNKKLIMQSLDFINFTVNAVQSMNSAPTGNSYQAKGNRYGDYQGKNFFDAKQ